MVAMRPYVADFLTRLHQSHRDVVLVTNAHRKTLDIKMEHVDITGWFDRVVVSHELDAPKEEQAFWHRLQQEQPFDPRRTLFVDDSLAVLRSAQRYGIADLLAIRLPDRHQAAREIDEFAAVEDFAALMPGLAACRT